MPATYSESLQDLFDTFEMLEDWEARYGYLLDLAKQLPPLSEAEKNEQTLVRGCMSQVWLVGGVENGLLAVRGDSDAHIVKGLIALLLLLVNARRIEDVRALNFPEIFAQLGLESHLSMNRRNGFYAMVERIQSLAG